MSDAGPKNAPVGAVHSALRILRYLAQTPEPKRLRDISGDLALNPSTCLNILRTLVAHDVVHHDARAKLYSPGLGLVGLARTALGRDTRVEEAVPLLRKIASDHAVSAMLWRRMGDNEMVLLVLETADNGWRVQTEVGSISALLQGAMGRVMAQEASLDETELQRRFMNLSWDRPPTFTEFLKEAKLAGERGWSVDCGNYNASMTSFCVAIREFDGSCRSVITSARLNVQQCDDQKLVGDMAQAAERLTAYPSGS